MIRAAPSDPPLDASLSEETRVGVEALVRYEGKVFALFSFYYKTENTSPVRRCRRTARRALYTLRKGRLSEHRDPVARRTPGSERGFAAPLPRLLGCDMSVRGWE